MKQSQKHTATSTPSSPETDPSSAPGGPPILFYITLFATPLLAGGNNFWFGDAAIAEFIWFLLVLLTWAWVCISRPIGFRQLLGHRPLWPLFLFALWFAISCVGAVVTDSAVQTGLNWLAAGLLGLTVLQLRPDRKAVLLGLGLLLGSAALAGVYGVYQAFVILPDLARDSSLSADDLRLLRESQRPFSLYLGPNPFGGLMAVFLPLGVLLMLVLKRVPLKLLAGLGLIAVTVGLIASYSRGAWLVFLLGLFPVAGLLVKGKARWAVAGLLAAILVAVYIFWNMQSGIDPEREKLNAPMTERLTSITNSADMSAKARVGYWRTAANMGADHWFMGGGPGNFADISRQYQTLPNYTRDPHNIFLRLFAETGTVGLLLFLWLVGSALWAAYKHGKHPEFGVFSSWVALGLLMLLMHASIDIDFSAPAQVGVFFVLAAFLWLPGLPPIPEKGKPADPILRTLLATGILLAAFGLRFFSFLGDAYQADTLWAMNSNAHAKAVEFNRQSLVYWPWDPQSHYQHQRLAIADYKMTKDPDNLQVAMKAIATALKLNPKNPEFYIGLADILAMQGDMQKAIRAIEEGAKLYPASVHYQSELARALSLSGNHAAALRVINQALATYETEYLRHRNPNGMDLVAARFLRAAILNDDKKWDEAKAEYDNIVTLCNTPGLILNAYTSTQQTKLNCEQIVKQAQAYKERVDTERLKPDTDDAPPVNLPRPTGNIPLRMPKGTP